MDVGEAQIGFKNISDAKIANRMKGNHKQVSARPSVAKEIPFNHHFKNYSCFDNQVFFKSYLSQSNHLVLLYVPLSISFVPTSFLFLFFKIGKLYKEAVEKVSKINTS